MGEGKRYPYSGGIPPKKLSKEGTWRSTSSHHIDLGVFNAFLRGGITGDNGRFVDRG